MLVIVKDSDEVAYVPGAVEFKVDAEERRGVVLTPAITSRHLAAGLIQAAVPVLGRFFAFVLDHVINIIDYACLTHLNTFLDLNIVL